VSTDANTGESGELLKHNIRPTAVTANEGTRLRASYIGRAGRAKGRVDVTAATHCNDGGKRALWMLAKCSKMSEQSQCQDEGEQRPGDERRANSRGFLRDQHQPRTRTCVQLKKSRGANECKGFACLRGITNPDSCSAEEEVGRKRFRRVCAGEAAGTRACVWPNRWSTNTGVCCS